MYVNVRFLFGWKERNFSSNLICKENSAVICNDNQSVPTFLFVGEMINFDLMSIILSLTSFF